MHISKRLYWTVLVGDLISLSELGSQTTLHGRLKNLSAMGYIKMGSNEDGRKKQVLPTKLVLKRYEEIYKRLEKAATKQAKNAIQPSLVLYRQQTTAG